MPERFLAARVAGRLFRIPLRVVAEHRMRRVASQTVDGVFRRRLWLATGWARTEMTWADVREHAVAVDPTEAELVAGWKAAEMTITDDHGNEVS